jgi:hypothetical protein
LCDSESPFFKKMAVGLWPPRASLIPPDILFQKRSKEMRTTHIVMSQSTCQRAIVCVDISGSVSNNSSYWKIVDAIVTQWKEKYTSLTYVLWNSTYSTVTEAVYQQHQIFHRGGGGTSPVEIVKAIRANAIYDNICIITDGEVNANDVAEADSLLQKLGQPIDHVECHIINRQPNLSVSCPFTRGNTAKVFTHTTYNGSWIEQTPQTRCVFSIHRNDYQTLDEIDRLTWDEVEQQYETIQKMILSLNMGKRGNPDLKTKLIKAKQRIIAELCEMKTKSQSDFSTLVRSALNANDVATAVGYATVITRAHFSTDNIGQVNKKMDQLISLCGDLRNTFSTDCIASAKVDRADNVEQHQLVDYDTDMTFTCPILYDEDCPVLLLEEPETEQSILVGLDKNTTDFILECPLRLLNNPELVEKVKQCIKHVTGAATYNRSNRTNPFTRRPVVGCIPLGKTTNCIDVADHALSCLFTQNKRLGNMDLWLCVIYLIARDISFLSEHMDHFTQHLKWRLSETTTYASLTGLVTLPNAKCKTDVAIWFIFGSYAYQYNGASDPIRFHMPHIHHLQTLATLCFGEACITPAMKKYISQVRIMLRALKYVKTSPAHHKYLMTLCKGLYQLTLIVPPHNNETNTHEFASIALIDGKQTEEGCKQVLTLIKEILHCEELKDVEIMADDMYVCLKDVDPSKSAGVVEMKNDVMCPPYVQSWHLDDAYVANLVYHVPISNKTYRPCLTFFDQTYNRVMTWQESATLRYGYDVNAPSEHFNSIKLFTSYVIMHKMIPTFEQYAMFAFKTLQHRKPSLPGCIKLIYEAVMRDYEPAFAHAREHNISVEQVADIMLQSKFIKDRERMEAI